MFVDVWLAVELLKRFGSDEFFPEDLSRRSTISILTSVVAFLRIKGQRRLTIPGRSFARRAGRAAFFQGKAADP